MKNKITLAILILSMITLIFSGCDGGGSVTPPIPDQEQTEPNIDIPTLQSPLCGKPTDRQVLLAFGKDWTWSYCGGLPKKHTGVDLNATIGESVYASESGTVKPVFNASSTHNWGQGFTIEHSGFTTLYLHVVPLVSSGQAVSKGQRIATIADINGPPHLHYGVRRSAYSNISNRGALPQKNTTENDPCQNDPIFPENFVDPMTLTYEVTCPEEEVTLDSFRVAFEDIEWANWSGGDCQGNNDYDYEDCVCDVDVDGKFICGDHLKEVKFTITYLNDGSGTLDHEFGLKMPSIFVGESCTYNLNGSISSRVPCPGEFVFFHEDTATPGEVFYLTITFESPFVYSYSGFVQTDIHGNLIDIKPFINIYWDSDNSFKEKLLAGTGDKRVLLVPDGWQWPSSDRTPLWDVYAEVIENNCYPVFTNPGSWTWTGGTPIQVSAPEEENVALHKPVSVTVTGNITAEGYEGYGKWPEDITDGRLDASYEEDDGTVGWVNSQYNSLMTIKVTIDLQGTYRINRILYNMGNVQRAETWNADTMSSLFGTISTNSGSPYRGTWTEHTGDATLYKVDIVFTKTRTSWATDWLFIGEIEVYGVPD